MGIIGFVEIQLHSMRAGRRDTYIAKTDRRISEIFCVGGNRTPVSSVAGENSTTEPPTLLLFYSFFTANISVKQCLWEKSAQFYICLIARLRL